jgi:hypothetical protein
LRLTGSVELFDAAIFCKRTLDLEFRPERSKIGQNWVIFIFFGLNQSWVRLRLRSGAGVGVKNFERLRTPVDSVFLLKKLVFFT